MKNAFPKLYMNSQSEQGDKSANQEGGIRRLDLDRFLESGATIGGDA